MAKSYWLINSNKSDIKRFMKNDKSIDGVFEYMFIDTGKIAVSYTHLTLPTSHCV